ncbi:uncharacterized protein LOC128244792 isoform X1 [Mya arenaria]|uniref:uncharacterized protein LOC128244792 isoform X1 n=2 Tax=Mya arenaria TaxID=6604 RepID=UPI0022E987A1|nr:uncharacterized protein LOC128244792 isoform X1 [Mya arenaria]
MQQMPPGGSPHMQNPSLSQGGIGSPPHMQDPGLSQGHSQHHGHPYNQPNRSNAPGHFDPQSNMSHEHGVQDQYAQHDQVAPGYNHAPHAQVMIRDANTPIIRYITPSMRSIIAKRVLSVFVLIFNETLNWLQYCDWKGTIDLPPVFGQIGKKSKTDVIECSAEGKLLPTFYGLFCGVATVYAVFQIINIIGETVLEYHRRKPGNKYEETGSSLSELPQNSAQPGPQERSQKTPEIDDEDPERQGDEEQKSFKQRCVSIFYGFQLLHGWVETAAAMVVEDLPQIIVMAFSSYYCTVSLENAVFLLIWMVVKELKNVFRKAFCKHKYTACACDCDCGNCFKGCCTYTCPCCCVVFVCRLCPEVGEKSCEMRPVNCKCPDCKCPECKCPECKCPECKCDFSCNFCSGPSICDRFFKSIGPKDEDPEWAPKLLLMLKMLAGVGWFAIVLFQILGLSGSFHASK